MLSGKALERNPGVPFEMSWLMKPINRNCVERRAAQLGPRRSVKKQWQAAWLLHGVRCVDLTSLAGDDTPGNITRMCKKGISPVRVDLLKGMNVMDRGIKVAAICVYPSLVKTAVEALAGTDIPVASVATGFPAGQIPLPLKIEEIRSAVADGAREIDIVISRALVLTGKWEELYKEVRAYREACGEAHLKTILATGELATLKNVYMASMVCMMAGADFIKTSTGKETVNATIPVGLVMVRAIREYYHCTGYRVGFKAAGGIRSAKDVLVWLVLMKEELGEEWMQPELFRIGASSLITDIERQLYHWVNGHYARLTSMPMG